MEISSDEEFRQLMVMILKKGSEFLTPIKYLKDPYDFYAVYEKTIEIASDHFNATINDEKVPFNMKFNLVIIVMELQINDGTRQLTKNILLSNFESDSKLLNEIKNDALVNTNIANLACLQENFDVAYKLLNYLCDNISNIPFHDYQIANRNITKILGSLDNIIQEKLYNIKSSYINRQVIDFSLLLIQMNNPKKEGNEVYQILRTKYPEILLVYETALRTLKKFQAKFAVFS